MYKYIDETEKGPVVRIDLPERSNSILVKVTDDDDHLIWANWAIVELAPAMLQVISEFRKHLADIDPTINNVMTMISTYSMYCEYLDQGHTADIQLSDSAIAAFERIEKLPQFVSEEFTYVPDGLIKMFPRDMDAMRLDMPMVHVDSTGFWFTANPHYAPVQMKTSKLYFKSLQL